MITINGIKFTNVPLKRLGLKMSLGLTQSNVPEQGTVEEYLQSNAYYKLIHALDIDWDGIEVEQNVIINDTADLIKWIASLPMKGTDGITPHIGNNGNWFIGDVDTEIPSRGATGPAGPLGADGNNGKSAYEIYCETVPEGEEPLSPELWLDSLKGQQGETGPAGLNGKSAYGIYKETVVESNAIYTFESFDPTGETKYGDGEVEVIDLRTDGATVKVLSNNPTDPNAADFVGMEFNVATLDTTELITLYSTEGLQQPIKVRVALKTPAVKAMTLEEWLASLHGQDAISPTLAAVATSGNYNDLSNKPTIPTIPSNISVFVNDAGYLTQHQSLVTLFNDVNYDSQAKRINFKHGETVLAYIDTTDFIKDGMVSNVAIIDGKLTISFNTDSGQSPIEIPITNIFNPNNYYTTQEIDIALGNKVDNSVIGNLGNQSEAILYNAEDPEVINGLVQEGDVKVPAVPNTVKSYIDEVALGGIKIVKITESAYEALATKDSNVLYIVTAN